MENKWIWKILGDESLSHHSFHCVFFIAIERECWLRPNFSFCVPKKKESPTTVLNVYILEIGFVCLFGWTTVFVSGLLQQLAHKRAP